MGIFDFLKSKQKTENQPTKNSELKSTTETKTTVEKSTPKTVFDLFEIDFKASPNESFITGNTDINESGDEISNFRKDLNPKECGLFDTLELKTFEGKANKNFIFTNFNFQKSDVNKVQKLVDQLYLFYGLDSMNNGKFNKNDNLDFQEDYWSGRMWTDEKHKNPAMISYDPESGLSLTIWLTE
ncbi:hypothetical protein [Lacinutrix sp. Bg11-31]|uniref:hypothetical protein n=1 Tax=Lacinutrix sp. Bg11-31 TaxID=2057808 RepID=UPI000C3032A6|nr:hypothetical protein [Lacinutrix sp. Bg11-31]AUC81097.1 hypothetical protein CW733_02705 [Lacinutrix sp. Bg11-31]